MTKQEFMAMSLQHKLKVYVKYSHKPDNSELETMIGIVDDCIITDMPEEDIAPLSISNYGLCLRPLSDLTKEVEHGGERFVPSKLLSGGHGSIEFKYSFILNNSISIYEVNFWIIQKLIEWHFDIAGLIEKGEAIDINTLEENPYK